MVAVTNYLLRLIMLFRDLSKPLTLCPQELELISGIAKVEVEAIYHFFDLFQTPRVVFVGEFSLQVE